MDSRLGEVIRRQMLLRAIKDRKPWRAMITHLLVIQKRFDTENLVTQIKFFFKRFFSALTITIFFFSCQKLNFSEIIHIKFFLFNKF